MYCARAASTAGHVTQSPFSSGLHAVLLAVGKQAPVLRGELRPLARVGQHVGQAGDGDDRNAELRRYFLGRRKFALATFLPVECDGPCDVEARVGDGFDRVRLTKAGRARFQLFTDAKRPRVRLTYSAPAGPETATKIVSLRVRTVDTLGALPRPLDVKAVRRGGKIEVSWRTAKPLAGDQTGIVYGTRTRSVKQDPLDVAPVYLEADKRRFSGTLTHDVREQRWVTLTVNHFEKTVKVH